MPTRRTFLGLLATAPVTVPDMAKAASRELELAGMASGGYVDGYHGYLRFPDHLINYRGIPRRLEIVAPAPTLPS